MTLPSEDIVNRLLRGLVMFSNQTIDIPFLRENFASLSGQQKMDSLTRCYPPMSRSAVMQATSTGSVPAVECLLNGLAINQRVQVLGVQDQNGDTALHLAASSEQSSVLQPLIYGLPADDLLTLVSKRNGKQETVIHVAVRKGSINVLSFFLNQLSHHKFTLLQAQDCEDRTALHTAALNNQTGQLELLLRGLTADSVYRLLSIQDADGNTGLHIAASAGHTNILKAMLGSTGGDDRLSLLKVCDKNGETLLHKASAKDDVNCFKCVWEVVSMESISHALALRNNNRESALSISMKRGGHLVYSFLVQQKLPVMATNASSSTAGVLFSNSSPLQLVSGKPVIPSTAPIRLLSTSGFLQSAIRSAQASPLFPHTSLVTLRSVSTPARTISMLPKPTPLLASPNPIPAQMAPVSFARLCKSPAVPQVLLSPQKRPNSFLPSHFLPAKREKLASTLRLTSANSPLDLTQPLKRYGERPIMSPSIQPSRMRLIRPAAVRSSAASGAAVSTFPVLSSARPVLSAPQLSVLASRVSVTAGSRPSAPQHVPLAAAAAAATVSSEPVRFETVIQNHTVTLNVQNRKMRFPFSRVSTVKDLVGIIREECVGAVPEIEIITPDDAHYCGAIELSDLDLPFTIVIGNIHNVVTEVRNTSNQAETSTVEQEPLLNEPSTSSPENTIKSRFRFIHTPKLAIELMEYVHSELSSGRAKSINDALKEIGKVRKTVDRFRYIYYLNIVDRNSFAEVETNWMNDSQKGGMCRLGELCEEVTDWSAVEEAANEGRLTIFGKRRR